MADVVHRPAPNNPRVAKVIMSFSSDTRVFQNVFHVSAPAPWSSTELSDLAIDYVQWWNSTYKARMSSDVSLTLVQTRKLDPASPLGVDYPVIPPIPGTLANPSVPSNATLTMSWRTGLAGRRFRGRSYVPGIVQADVSTVDSASSPLVNALLAAGTQLITTALRHGVLTIFHAPNVTPSPFDNLFNDVTTVVVENLIDSQRRRLPARGR